MRNFALASGLFVSLALGVACGDKQLIPVGPEIFADVCAKPQQKANGKIIGGVEQCALDFATGDITVKVTKKIVLTNPTKNELTILAVALTGDPSFKVELAPDTIGPGLSGDVVVSVRPSVATSLSGTLTITSDATNGPQVKDNSVLTIPLSITGVDNGVPDIDVAPVVCDFGHVAVGGVKVCEVTLSNRGTRGLVLDSVDFGAPSVPAASTLTPFAFVGRPPSADEEIAPTSPPDVQPVKLTVRFTPDTLGLYESKYTILSNDPDEPSIDVTLSGVAVDPPTCNARIASINGQPVTGAAEVQPLDDVVVTLADSTTSTPDGSLTAYSWTVVTKPAASQITPASPGNVSTGFTFADGKIGIDFTGSYKICGSVVDDAGTASVNECCVSFDAIPKQNLLAELSWDTDVNDFDLHVTKQSDDGRFCIQNTSGDTPAGLVTAADCSALDCNFSTCRSTSTTGPEWDGIAGRGAGDPSLDIDDIKGFGPENENVDVMPPGNYLVGVDEYSATSTSTGGATVRIFIYGRLAAEFFKEMNPGEYREVAVIHWPADPVALPCVEDLTDGDATDDCGP